MEVERKRRLAAVALALTIEDEEDLNTSERSKREVVQRPAFRLPVSQNDEALALRERPPQGRSRPYREPGAAPEVLRRPSLSAPSSPSADGLAVCWGLSTSRLGHALGRVSFGQRQQRQPEEGEEVPLFAPGAADEADETSHVTILIPSPPRYAPSSW
ncbi:hypothetical protein HPB47_008399 [Ixodes persulcatus]|uniref:Uncharacterized protein n=1 Tax=Ixodes persulcatus TaxID=34615 RepID=A0AC60P4X3_IXOPE|nr:hypothetical protein HPB47_008399 [Ixodes persulcatus]